MQTDKDATDEERLARIEQLLAELAEAQEHSAELLEDIRLKSARIGEEVAALKATTGAVPVLKKSN
jgi:hypothetical protein